jgi:hypothetical protein
MEAVMTDKTALAILSNGLVKTALTRLVDAPAIQIIRIAPAAISFAACADITLP